MCRSMSSSGCASRNARISCGTTWSPADVTALMRSVARPPSAASRAARAALLEQPEHVRRVGRERRARAGRPQPAAVALEQLRADLALERGDRRRHRRLRDEQLLGGGRHRAAAHHADERRELGQRDGHRAGRTSARPAAPSPRAPAGCQSVPTVSEPSTHGPELGLRELRVLRP